MNSVTQEQIDMIEWDVANWRRALTYWDTHLTDRLVGRRGLEIGGQNGGLSLYLALKGCDVVCSDFRDATPKARAVMAHYKVSHRVTYTQIDVIDISYPENSFDIVAFKSVLGSVGIHHGAKGQQRAIDEMYRVLKPEGILLFAENLKGSNVHQFFRKRFVKWGWAWRYLTVREMQGLMSQFSTHYYDTYGYLACFGRSERQRRALSTLDWLINPFLKEDSKYIIYGYARK